MGQRTLLAHLRPSGTGAAPEAAAQAARHSDSASASASAETPALVPAKRKASTAEQKFDYFLVLDFEATCDKRKDLDPQELIEFSSCILDARSLDIKADFQRYCKPTENPVLTRFCTELTGIKQAWVDGAESLEEVLRHHGTWLRDQGVIECSGATMAPITWSDWDLQKQLETECKWRNIKRVPYLRRWVNLKGAFARRFGTSPHGLKKSVEAAGLSWEGRAHSGLDDALNTARLAAELMRRGDVLELTGWFEDSAPKQKKQATLFKDRPVPVKRHKTVDEHGKPTGKCSCGVKVKLRSVRRPGPNLGRKFWSCGKWSITGTKQAQCDFFQWVDDKPAAA